MRDQPPIFFHNQSDDATLRAIRALPDAPNVDLSDTIVCDLRSVLGLAGPKEPTVLLLWPKYIKRRAPTAVPVSAGAQIVVVVLSLLLALAAAVAHG